MTNINPRYSVQLILVFLCAVLFAQRSVAQESSALLAVNYLVLEGQAKPLQIEKRGSPLEGGIITEVVKDIFHESKIHINPVVAPWNRLERYIKNETFNNWLIWGWSDSDSISEDTEFIGAPLISWRQVLIAPKTAQVRFNTLNDLLNLNLILVDGFDYPGLDKYLKTKNNGPINDFRALAPENAIRMLSYGRGEAYVDTDYRAFYFMNKLGLKREQFDVFDFSSVINTKNIQLAVNAHMDIRIKRHIAAALDRIRRSGKLDKILQKYAAPSPTELPIDYAGL